MRTCGRFTPRFESTLGFGGLYIEKPNRGVFPLIAKGWTFNIW